MTCTLKHLAALVVEQGDYGPRPYVALENLQSGAGRLTLDELPQRDIADTGSCVVEPGDVLFGKLRPNLAKTWLVDRSVYATTELMALRPSISVEPRWLHYLVSSSPVIEWAVASSEGTKMPRTSWEKLRSMVIPDTPSLARQQAIADYLDAETARIDALIEKKRRMVELLASRMDALIERKILGEGEPRGPEWANGIGPDRAMTRLGSVLRIRGERNDPVRETQILSLTADRGVILYEDKGDVGNKASEDISRYGVVHAGDIVVNSMNVVIGSVGLSRYRGVLSPVYYVLCPVDPEAVDVRFLAYHFRIRSFQRQLRRLGYGILEHRLRIPWVNLKTQELALPPVEVQSKVADQLAELEQDNLAQRQKLLRSIALLDERRQAIVTSAVTGEFEIVGTRS